MKGASRPSATLFQLQRSTATSLAAAPSACPFGCAQLEQLVELVGEVDRVAGRERGQRAVALGVGLLQPGRDLGQARVPGDERRHAGRCGLRGHHPERLGEDRGHDDDVRERQQVDEVPVLERAREQRVPRRELLEVPAVVAEPDDQGARRASRAAPRSGGGRPCCRAACRSRGRSAARPRRSARGGVRCPRPGAARFGSRGSGGRAAPPRAARRAPRRGPAAGTRRRRLPAAPRARARRGRRPPRARNGCAPSRRRPRAPARAPPAPRRPARRCRESSTRAPSRAP